MGVSIIEERKTACCFSPKIYQPVENNMEGLTEIPRKKKMFSSSSFYEEPNCIYPTVEEQVKLCRKIAESLSDDCNVKSKGANMFFKRVKRAEKWIVAESNGQAEDSEDSSKDPAQMPYVRPSRDGPPCLKLILDPRHIIDMQYLLREGVDIVKHDTISPEVCHDIVKDLNSPTGRGGLLFAKRKKKSEEWIVDEEKVKHLLQTRYSSPVMPDINSQTVAQTVIRAAEAKVMSYPNHVPHHPVIESLDRVASEDRGQTGAYNSAPKGWTSNNAASSLTTVPEVPVSLAEKKTSTDLETATRNMPRNSSTLSRTMSFNNFNTTPRAWNANTFSRPGGIKPVRPSSMLLVQ